MNNVLNFVTSFTMVSIIFSFLNLGNCGNLESEKAYCDKKAKHYFLLCMLDIKTAPSYLGKLEWEAQEVQTYAMKYCIAEYNRKKRCADQKSYRPHRTD